MHSLTMMGDLAIPTPAGTVTQLIGSVDDEVGEDGSVGWTLVVVFAGPVRFTLEGAVAGVDVVSPPPGLTRTTLLDAQTTCWFRRRLTLNDCRSTQRALGAPTVHPDVERVLRALLTRMEPVVYAHVVRRLDA